MSIIWDVTLLGDQSFVFLLVSQSVAGDRTGENYTVVVDSIVSGCYKADNNSEDCKSAKSVIFG